MQIGFFDLNYLLLK